MVEERPSPVPLPIDVGEEIPGIDPSIPVQAIRDRLTRYAIPFPATGCDR